MQLLFMFLAVHFTAMLLMSWRKSNNIFGAYMTSGLIWSFLAVLGKAWLVKLASAL